MRRAVRVTVASLVLAVVWCAVPAARAQVLSQVPPEALVVLKVKNLKATSDKVAQLAQQWGVAQAIPQFADPLGSLKQQMQITNGLDEAGDLAFAFMDANTLNGRGDSVVVLLPVSDYKAFVANFADAKDTGSGVMQATVGNKPSFIANWGKYAAVSPKQALVAKKPAAGLKLAGATAKEMESKDAIFYANMPALRAQLLPKMKTGRTKALAEFDRKLATRPDPNAKKFAPVAKAAINRLFDVGEGFLRDAEGATYGFNFAPTGIGIGALAEFAPASYSGKLVAQVKNSDASLLAGLPATKYLYFGGMTQDPKVMAQMFNDLIAPIEKELQAGGEDMKPFVRYLTAARTMVAAHTGSSFGMFAPSGPMGQEPFVQFAAVCTGDAAKLRGGQIEAFKALQEAISSVKPAAGAAAGAAAAKPEAKAVVTPHAKTVEGVKFDQLQVQLNINAQSPQEQQVAQMMKMMYGPDGVTVLTGQVDDKHVLTISGANDAMIAQAITAAKTGEDALGKLPPVQQVSDLLPKQRVAAFYVPVDAILTTALDYAKQRGMPVNMELPPDLPPIGMTIATEGSSVRGDAYVPSQLVESIVAAAMQVMMNQGGGGGGQPRGGQPGGL